MIGENVRLEGPDFVPTNRFRGLAAVADAIRESLEDDLSILYANLWRVLPVSLSRLG